MLYTNVNTPLNDHIWQLPHNITPITAVSQSTAGYTPDPNYTPLIVYWPSDPTTSININKLTLHLKMDVYIDRTTGAAYYLDCLTGLWKPVVQSASSSAAVIALIKANRGVIDHSFGTDTLDLTIGDTGNNKIPTSPVTAINTLL